MHPLLAVLNNQHSSTDKITLSTLKGGTLKYTPTHIPSMLWAPWKMNGGGRAKKHTETGSAFPGLAVQNNTVPRDKMPEHRDYHAPCRGGESAYRPRKGRPWDGLAIGLHHCRRGKDVRGFPFIFYRLAGSGSFRILRNPLHHLSAWPYV